MKTYNLTINTPCSEKWENFSLTAKGGFCGSCNETVVDFTAMSDTEINQFFNARPTHTCGRFRSQQMKSYQQRPPLKLNTGMSLLKAGLICLTLALMQKPAAAQTTDAPSNARTEIVQKSTEKKAAATVGRDRTVSGIVRNESSNLPVPGYNVMLQGFTIGTATDVNGRFTFPQKLQEGDVLLFSFIGFETRTYVVPKDTKDDHEVVIWVNDSEMVIMGKVAVNDVYKEPSGVCKIWNKVKSKF